MKKFFYENLIIGAGPAGLFTACNLNNAQSTCILEKTSKPGQKLLMAGGGQCNITHAGDIKEFLNHYGNAGKKIRQVLYKFNNKMLMNYFEENHLKMVIREDNKVFPESLNGKDVLEVLLKNCQDNRVDIKYNVNIENIHFSHEKLFHIKTKDEEYTCRNLIVATGGCSYPTTGSDGKFFKHLRTLGIEINELHPALVPIDVKDYKYVSLAGISLQNVQVNLFRDLKKITSLSGDILFTHKNLSGPVILNISRYVRPGDILEIDYFNKKDRETMRKDLNEIFKGSHGSLNTLVKEYTYLPKRLIETISTDLQLKENSLSNLSNKDIYKIIDSIIADTHIVKGTAGFNVAMVTTGGVLLEEINLKTLSHKKNEQLFFVGEVLDVDGDTGGYNLQFAFSSAYVCCLSINGYNK